MLATWNRESTWTTGKRFSNPRSTRESLQNNLSRNSSIYVANCCRSGSRAYQHRKICGKRGRKNSNLQYQWRQMQEGRRPWAPWFLWMFHSDPWLGSKDSRYRNFNLTNSLHHPHFNVWRFKSETRWLTTCSNFRHESNETDTESRTDFWTTIFKNGRQKCVKKLCQRQKPVWEIQSTAV